ncbi:MAG TPA: hypothetical protein VHZ96_17040 [Frankiaceae bacterium]|jgi:hypothetical protein|nr:hypothetical protein [Frankiaceae bacterium]
MTAGPDPSARDRGVPAGRERGFGERRDPDEPRFAGPPTTGVRPDPPPWSTESTQASYEGSTSYPATYPTAPPPPNPPAPPSSFPPAPNGSLEATDEPFDPVVDYGPGVAFPTEPSDGVALSRLGSAVAAAGGLLAGIGTFFTWATLRLTANGADSQGFTADPSTISYNGLSLLEGRIMLVLGVLAIALGGAFVPRRAPRMLGPAMAVTGGFGVIVMAFAAIGHPVELATLFRSYRQIDAVKVSVPNGVGTWLAVIGALLILAGGLLALMRRSEMHDEVPQ